MEVRTIELHKSVFEDNDERAAELKASLKKSGVLLVNVMASPGAGKTTALIGIINRLSEKFKAGVMEADIDGDIDAVTVAKKTGVKSVQLHTGGMCHLDAEMTEQGLRALGVDFDIVFLENVGNLVCPAEYDTGAHINMTVLSVPEGDDKPLKYPLMYEKCDLVLINKIDALGYFNFDIDRCKRNILARNKNAVIIEVSAKTGKNMDLAVKYFTDAIQKFGEGR